MNPNGCQIQVMEWLSDSPYRSVQHRHNGTFRAVDESVNKQVTADTVALLADALLNWPEHGISFTR